MVLYTVNVLNFWTSKMFAVITLKSKQTVPWRNCPKGCTWNYKQCDQEKSDLGLHCLPSVRKLRMVKVCISVQTSMASN